MRIYYVTAALSAEAQLIMPELSETLLKDGDRDLARLLWSLGVGNRIDYGLRVPAHYEELRRGVEHGWIDIIG
jgi:hypothetical protein